MKEADKRARITVAYGGLALLQQRFENDPSYRSTRLKLFAVPRDEPQDPSIIKAVRSKDWQRDYIKRLVDAGVLIKNSEDSQELYYPSAPRIVAEIIEDHDKYGLRLSKFLFPNEAGMPKELIESEEEDSDEDEPTDLKERSAEYVKAEARTGPEALDGRDISRQLGALLMAQNLNTDFQRQVVLALQGVEARLPEAPTQSDREFYSYMKNRFKDLDARLGKIEESMHLSSRTLTRVDAGMNSLSTLVTSAIAGLKPMDMATEAFKHIRPMLGLTEGQTLAGLLAERFKLLEGGSLLRSTLTELRAKLSDLQAIEELALKAIEASEKSEVNNGS